MINKYNLFWLKNKIFRSDVLSSYHEALSSEDKLKFEIDSLNWLKRKSIVKYAYQNSSFYKEFYKSVGFSPEDLLYPEDWQKVPILEKQHLRDFRSSILTTTALDNKLIKTTTGGSTGAPVLTYRDKRFPEEILKWRMLIRWGVQPSDNMLMLWRMPPKKNKWLAKKMNKALWWPTIRYQFDVSSLSSDTLQKIEEILLKKQPPIVWGYVGALEQVALHFKNKKIKLGYTPLVWATASPISNVQLSLLQNVFGARILDQYACSEIHWIASSIPNSRNLLVDYDYRHVEVVNADNDKIIKNEIGDLLITDLENKAFPLIRYRNGDRSSMLSKDHEFNYGFPIITPVKGRVSDTLKSPSGLSIPGEYATTIFDESYNIVYQFKVHQRQDFSIDIFVCLSQEGKKCRVKVNEVLLSVSSDIKSKLANEVLVNAHIVDEIPHDRGKIRFIQSDV